MYLGKLIKSESKKYQKIGVKGISFDSRQTKKGDIFFAIKGKKTSGVKFIKQAISKGASAVICDKKNIFKNFKIPFIMVKDVRISLSEACSNFYKEKPSHIVAVTGTNGKSSVADFFYQILSLNKKPVASIGTLGIISKKYKKNTNLTSLDALSLHKYLKILAKKKIKYVILEASSHGLDQKRLDNLKINIGIFTNLSHDHLDYHKNIKSYFNSKMYLFKNLLNKNSKIITDEENKEFKYIKKLANKKRIIKHTIGSISGSIKILNNRYNEGNQIIRVLSNAKTFDLSIPLVGYFQVKNLLMSVLAASKCGISQTKIFSQIQKIKPVPGRLECVANLNNNSNIIVDFAHTPDALEQSLIAIKKQFKKKIIIVFGCGGERDKKKRLMMGKIAKKYCKKIFVTDDNPRHEDPKKIRTDIIKGCKKKAINIGSREKAIKMACKELGPNEILLVAGKGHEKTQDYGNKILNFSDKQVIKKIIKRTKFSLSNNKWSNIIAKQVFSKNNIGNLNYNGVSINTKTIKKNNLFFAIKGKRTDGHEFAKEAIKKGAIGSVISRKIKKISNKKGIKVQNTFSSLNDLAAVTRSYSCARIIGITGSVGKTSLKNLLSFALKNYGNVHFSPHSYNNKFGVPISISNLKYDSNYGVFEIGMDKKGEINNLSKIVKPEIGAITNISEAHLKNFKSLKDIAKAKAEIIDNIQEEGSIILNKDSRFYNFLLAKAKKRKINIISFSIRKKTDIFLLNVFKVSNLFRLKINVKNNIFYFDIKNNNKNFINNILACISIIYALSLNLNKMKKKFIGFKTPEGRGDITIVKKYNKKFEFVDESYNANPLSMKTAIENVSKYKRKKNQKKLVFLGDMLELGKKSKMLHKALSNAINKSDIDKVYVLGKHIRETFNSITQNKRGKIFGNFTQANNHFGKIINNNDLLMVKGSNATGLNRFSKNIKGRSVNAI